MFTDAEYNRVLEEIYERFPSFQVVGDRAYKPGLENMLELDKALGYPSRDFRTIHVAGTNGKGSVSHMIASALMQLPRSFRVGLYTSPHLVDFRERIKVNGQMVEKEWVYGFLSRNKPLFEELNASFFEITTAMAFSWFSFCKVDVAVIECGLGGRLDSTNIITPMASVITNIGYDHMQYLGNTLEEIAGEKAGIIKPGVPVIIGETGSNPDVGEKRDGRQTEIAEDKVIGNSVERVFVDKASDCATDIYLAEKLNPYNLNPDGAYRSFSHREIDLKEEALKSVVSLATCLLGSVDMGNMDLKGDCQKKNIKTVCAALAVIIRKLADETRQDLTERTITEMVEAIESAAHLTGLRGRWERLSDNPLIICDIGHNSHGMKVLMPQVERTFIERREIYREETLASEADGRIMDDTPRLIMFFGVMKDKDLAAEVEYLPKDAYYLYVNASTPRALPASELLEKMQAYGFRGEVPAETMQNQTIQTGSARLESVPAGSIQAGLQWIKENALPQDFVFIGGSSYVVAEVLANY
ncbi:MAG: hypothetical protein IK041_05845 [Bacteroidales bacterium]|nr:hypothetical protein [Bacteroidales bacterium]